jgi:dTDP-4-amino-4,6-dideoxygalactose transaminase
MIGNFSTCEVFSFHATKFLNSLEGGAVATNNDRLAAQIRLMRNFGFVGYDDVIHPGSNGKMVEACAAMGIVNLDSIDAFVARNRANYELYASKLEDVRAIRLLEFSHAERNNFQYVVAEVARDATITRDHLVETLHSENVLARRYFWPGCHRMQPYRELFPWADAHLPNTNAVAERVIVLPTGTAIGETEIQTICDVIRCVVGTD